MSILPKYVLIPAKDSVSFSAGVVIGGTPIGANNTIWPECLECAKPLQFLFCVSLNELGYNSDYFLSTFQCMNDPGMCDSWDAVSGANKVIITKKPVSLTPPNYGVTELEKGSKALSKQQVSEFIKSNQNIEEYFDYFTSISAVGSVGGEAIWVQHDETPSCEECEVPMEFILSLEEQAHKGLNFGAGGTAYLFKCKECFNNAAFLWQC